MKKLIMHGRGYSFGPKPFNPLEDVTHWWQLDTSHYSNYTYTDLTGYTDKVLKNRRPTSTNISVNADCTTVNAMYYGADLPNVYTDNTFNPFVKTTETWGGQGCFSFVISWDGNNYSNSSAVICGDVNNIGWSTSLAGRWWIGIASVKTSTSFQGGDKVCIWCNDGNQAYFYCFDNVHVPQNEITVLQLVFDLPNGKITCIINNDVSQTITVTKSTTFFNRTNTNSVFTIFHRAVTKTSCPSAAEIFTGSIYEVKFWNKIKSSSYLEEDYNRISERYGLNQSSTDDIYFSLLNQTLVYDLDTIATRLCAIGEEALGVTINGPDFYDGDPIEFSFFANFPEGTTISIQIDGKDMQNIDTIDGVSVDNSYSRTFNFTVSSQTEVLDEYSNHWNPPQYSPSSNISSLTKKDSSAQAYMYVSCYYTVPNGQPKAIGLDVYLN